MDRNIEIFLTSRIDFLFIFEQCGDNCKYNLFLKKVGVAERPRALNPSALSLFILVLGERARCEVACEFARAAVRSKDAQKQLVRTSLSVTSAMLVMSDKPVDICSYASMDKVSAQTL